MIEEGEYKKRRDTFSKVLQDNSVAVLLSAEFQTRSNDTEYPYRQNSNFYYLTGFKEDNAFLVFVKVKKKLRTILFVQEKDEKMELWNGKRLGEQKAKELFMVDEVYSSKEFKTKFEEFVKDIKFIFYDFAEKYEKVKFIYTYAKQLSAYENLAPLINKMRLIKSSTEIDCIQKAIDITQQAHHQVICLNKIGKMEYQLQAEIEYIFKSKGAYSDAYISIVACGNSANTLHYISNDKSLEENELILIDAGCEYQYYASDITRTIPVSGKFSEPQKELYEMVLDVQLQIMQLIAPKIKRSYLQKRSEELLCMGLVRLGILKGSMRKLLKEKKHKKYYPHGIGHWMGLDVHDQAPYKDEKGKEILLQVGMLLTIEPAIYIDKDDETVPEKYRGIGIRIEDDILVTQEGHKNLSQGIAKTIAQIEKLFDYERD